jgi:acetyl-CoA carboxylase biotin carboxylase subunit
MRRVFVANRGEIAVRIVRACRALGLEAVVGVSEVDRESMAARLADRAVCIGPARASESYLKPETIVHAALATGCDAIHPGYGFLSENPRLAALCTDLAFVGPPAGVIELAGDKLRARACAADAGLPVVPGGEVAHPGEAVAFGFPLLLKAAAGGGGRGIRLARDEAELRAQFAAASAEAEAAFGDARVYVERYVQAGRHVEVQIAADTRGHVVHLGERDCSVQRRYQKVIEEAPAPDLAVRDELTRAAVRFAEAIGYVNLGTVEFMVDGDAFSFLEMNCRIQVEHPVTEEVTGRDLVAEQLRIAAGEPLGFTQDEVAFDGHAIEARLTADEAGRLTRFALPDGLRVDTHCAAGALIPPHYDSLMAKRIARGDDRDAALRTLRDGLEALEVAGVRTNRETLRAVLAHEDFARGAVTTRWLEEAFA